MARRLDATAVRSWCAAAVTGLTAAQQEIDDLNVYPVPDGDTGTNLVHTLRAAAAAMDEGGRGVQGVGPMLRCMARGALLGARGNSGVIVSQLLRGAADALSAGPTAGGREFAGALARACEAAYAAVSDPVEGTILSVARAAADAAGAAGDDLAAVVRAAAAAAAAALQRTPDQLPALARAGVVDAGGRGLVVLLDTLTGVLAGDSTAPAPPPQVVKRPRQRPAAGHCADSRYGYEVQYLLDAEEAAAATLRAELAPLGDSLLVAGTGDGLLNVHIHVNDVGAAIECGIRAGRPHRIRVTRFAEQAADPDPPATQRRGVVAVANGAGLAAVLAGEGVQVVAGGAGRAPSTTDLLAAIRRTRSDQVVLLPNDRNIHAVAGAAAEEARAEGRTVAVVPTRSVVQGLAALAVRDPQRRFADDVIAMADAAGATRWAEVTRAVREARTAAGPCRAGDVLGLIEGDVVDIGNDLAAVARRLLDQLLTGGAELVTIVVGDGADSALARDLAQYALVRRPGLETVVYDGGQAHYPLLLGR